MNKTASAPSTSLISTLLEYLPVTIVRFIFNIWPPFRGAGIKVNYIAKDYRAFDVSLKLGLLNRNYAGVHFGGSLFSMTDPFYMFMYAKNLGNDYIVWDKAAKIDFKKPGKGIIRAKCSITEEDINTVRENANCADKYIFDRTIDLYNEKNEIVATIIKTLYIKRKI